MARKGKQARKAAVKKQDGVVAPFVFKISKKLRDELPPDEQEKASAWLWQKADGRCALCGELLPLDASEIEADHRVARSGDGPTQLTNLFLAHRSCNRRRGNLPFEVGAMIARFFAWAEKLEEVDFGDVLAEYVPGHGKLPAYKADEESAELDFGGLRRSAELFTDPATLTKYFFTLVPTTFILNDDDSQPRHIFPDHVRALAQDFTRHPVHEPSNVRLVNADKGRVKLLQFDGQHKTTAQILLGRDEIPVKVYVRPDLAMLQELVVAIQQGIKKRPLSTSDTLRKLGDVMRDLLEKYPAPSKGHRTERGLIDAQPADRRREVKRIFLQDCMRGILLDEDCELKEHISAGRSGKSPLSDRVAVEKLIRPLVYQDVTDDDMDSGTKYGRDHERQNVIMVLNEITHSMILDGWNSGDAIAHRRAQNFFYQGAIGWWVNDVLLPAVHYGLRLKKADRDKIFLRKLSKTEKEDVKLCIKELCAWPIWSTNEREKIAAFRSNTVQRVAEAFPRYDDDTLRSAVYG